MPNQTEGVHHQVSCQMYADALAACTDPCCYTCKYGGHGEDAQSTLDTVAKNGAAGMLCFRHPPQVVGTRVGTRNRIYAVSVQVIKKDDDASLMGAESRWPIVSCLDWCGEYQRRDGEV